VQNRRILDDQKGSPILIEGRLQIREWQDREGNKRRTAEINVDTAYFCGGKKESAAPAEMQELPDNDEKLPWEEEGGELPL
jgi:single-strand DNA-binding protein